MVEKKFLDNTKKLRDTTAYVEDDSPPTIKLFAWRRIGEYTPGVKRLSPDQTLWLPAMRMRKRADHLERVHPGYGATVYELRFFASMIDNARNYLHSLHKKHDRK